MIMIKKWFQSSKLTFYLALKFLISIATDIRMYPHNIFLICCGLVGTH